MLLPKREYGLVTNKFRTARGVKKQCTSYEANIEECKSLDILRQAKFVDFSDPAIPRVRRVLNVRFESQLLISLP
jgi:hypothetical protein